jgi:hypothetical protein
LTTEVKNAGSGPRSMRGGARFLRPIGEAEMDRNTTIEPACLGDCWSVGKEPALSPRSEMRAAFRLSRGEALILVLLLSFGLWAATWGAVALLAVGGQW